MGYAIMRMEPRSIGGTTAMLKHALRELKVPNAVDGGRPPMHLEGVKTTAEGVDRLSGMVAHAKANKAWQKSIKPVLDVLVTFSPDDTARLTPAEQADYFKRAAEHVCKQFGGTDNLLTAVVHYDESTPHLQLLIAARHPDGKLSSSRFMGNQSNLKRLQTEFWTECGKPFGLLRGIPRTGAKNIPQRTLYSAMANGAEVPKIIPVPPEPGFFTPKAEELRAAHDAAIAHNEKARALLERQASIGRQLHPTVMARQAKRYRTSHGQVEALNRQVEEATGKLNEIQKAIAVGTKHIDLEVAHQVEEARRELAEIRKSTAEGTQYIAQLNTTIGGKQDVLAKLDRDIDNLRAIRDLESRPEP